MLRLAREAQTEDPIRLHPEAMELVTLAHLNLPAEGQPQAPGRLRCRGEYLLGPDELDPFRVAAGHLEGYHDLGDGEGVAEEPRRGAPRCRRGTHRDLCPR
jgi:hypothetical protein